MVNLAISEQDVRNFKALLDYFKRLAEDGVTQLIEKQLLIMLDQAIPFFGHLHSENLFPELTRITINKNVLGKNSRIKDIKYLKYPPAEKVSKYGRCNLPKQSVFYATFTQLTAFNELKPLLGDLVTVSHWKLKDPNRRLRFCPIFKNQPKEENSINVEMYNFNKVYEKKTKHLPTHFKQQSDALIQFVADAFTKHITSKNDLDYIFSAYFSNKILHEFENGKIDAIYYPSVQDKLHFQNIAIKPAIFDELYALHEVHDRVIINTPKDGGGGYFGRGFGHCKTFNTETGEILWDPEQLEINKDTILDLKWKYGFQLELE